MRSICLHQTCDLLSRALHFKWLVEVRTLSSWWTLRIGRRIIECYHSCHRRDRGGTCGIGISSRVWHWQVVMVVMFDLLSVDIVDVHLFHDLICLCVNVWCLGLYPTLCLLPVLCFNNFIN